MEARWQADRIIRDSDLDLYVSFDLRAGEVHALCCENGASTSTVGSLMELDAAAACVIGGTSLRGGRGSVLGVLFGTPIMASLLNGMTLMAVSPEAKYIARGAVLALAVWLDLRMGQGGR